MSDSQASWSTQRSATLSGRVQNQLNLLSASMQRTQLLFTVLLILLAAAVVILSAGIVDYFFPMTAVMRAMVLLAIGMGAVIALIKCVIAIRDIGPFDAAIDIEHAHPELGQRLRTAWQFRAKNMTASASPELVDALIEDTNTRTEQMSFVGIVSRAKLLPAAAAVVIAILFGLAMLVWVPETRITFARLALFPIHYSQVKFNPPEEPITAGSAITLNAEVTGRPVPRAELLVRQLNSEEPWTRLPMTASQAPQNDEPAEQEPAEVLGEVSAKLDDCQHDLEYKVVAGPVVTRTYQLKVLQPLEQESFAAQVNPPAYTGLEPTSVDDLSFAVPEGSQVQLQVTLNRAAESARLVPMGGGNRSPDTESIDLKIAGRRLVCDLGPLTETQQFEIVARASDGMSFESDRVRIRVNKDHKPVVKFNRPAEQIEATPTTEVALAVSISDDYGLGKVGVEYQIGNGQRRVLWQQDLKGEESSITTIPVLYLEKHQLNFDDAITYYAFAEDHRETPRRSSSELRFIDIRPYKREFQIVDSACQGGGGACLTLEELIARQRQNLRRTFANVESATVSDSLAQRLATTQREIREATSEFTTGWESRFGPIPSLHDAAASMELAEAELGSKRMPTGLLLEQAALESLIRSRQNLRKFIKNCSSGSLSQCQSYDNQMLQKLRAPAQKDKRPEGNPPNGESIQSQLDQLATQQREWSEQLRLQSSGGVQLEKKNSPQSQANASPQPAKPKTMSQLAQSQQASSNSAQQMQQALRDYPKASQLSQQRMDEIAERIQQSLQDLRDGKTSAAAQEAERAAELAQQLNEQLRGLGAADLSERLGVAEQIARRVAAGEQDVSQQLEQSESMESTRQEAMADVQEQLAEQVATLGDLLKYLEADASLDHPEMQRDLRDLQEMHNPGTLSEEMHSSAGKIRQGQFGRARKGTEDASRELSAVARGLASIRREFLQPRLDDLMAAEAKAAGMLTKLKDIDDPATQAQMTSEMGQLQAMLRALNIEVSTAASNGATSNPRPTTSTSNQEQLAGASQPHWGHPTLGEEAQLRQIIRVLQQKIQDAIMLAARMDADEPVPPIYRRLVDEYYQTLSDDLR